MRNPSARDNAGLNREEIVVRKPFACSCGWYVRPTLEARRLLGAFAVVGLFSIGACGGGERQDENEPEGNFRVDVVRASFPKKQSLAQKTALVITLRNADDETVPNIAVTVDGFEFRSQEPDVADPARPRFAVNGVPREIGGFPEAKDTTPPGCETAYVNTWACGPLRPGREKTLRWSVTPVKAGSYDIRWRVAAGLNGKAKAVADGGGAPTGSFSGTVSAAAPKARVADDGKTVIIETP
jgi:hypothetical protein